MNFDIKPLHKLYTAIIYDRFEEFLMLLKYGANPNLIIEQPGFSNSLIDGSIRHNADVHWIKVRSMFTLSTNFTILGPIHSRNEPLSEYKSNEKYETSHCITRRS